MRENGTRAPDHARPGGCYALACPESHHLATVQLTWEFQLLLAFASKHVSAPDNIKMEQVTGIMSVSTDDQSSLAILAKKVLRITLTAR